MDTLGTIRPLPASPQSESQRTEALERLRYLALQGRCGVLIGARGAGKTDLLNALEFELNQEAIQTSRINLAGLVGEEIPTRVADEFGLGLSARASLIQTWTSLQDFSSACARSGEKHILLFDQLERADESTARALERLLTLFQGTFSCLFASRPKLNRVFRTLIKNQSWMTVKLERLSKEEASETFSKEVSALSQDVKLADDVTEAVDDLTSGRIDKMKRLAELAAIAAEAEQLHEINAEIIRALQGEILLD